jgi:hypothetical protein
VRAVLVTCVVAAAVGANAAVSTSAAHITALRARFYNEHVHFGVHYGGYDLAPVDVRVYRTRGLYHRIADHRLTIGRRWRKVYADDVPGSSGLAVFEIYYEDLAACRGTASRTNYVSVFRLFNPRTDTAVDCYRYSFYVRCR